MRIYCCGCGQDVEAKLVCGKDVYPHRRDLYQLPFWQCERCRCFVGCHHKSHDPTRPLGVIPTREITKWRKRIHALLDPLWQTRQYTRSALYKELGARLGYEYHTAEIRSVEQAMQVLEAIGLMRGEHGNDT